MRFFTPELYRRFNSSDDNEADLANNEWESAIERYQTHLAGIEDKMPSQVRKLSELCLHDAAILGYEQEMQSSFSFPGSASPSVLWMNIAIFSLGQEGILRSLIYLLWDRVREFPVPENWPFSQNKKCWLYDEIDLAGEQPGMFLHRILFSDGSISEIPFISVIQSVVTMPTAEEGATTRRSA